SQPISAALPVSCSHRSTRASFAAVSRRALAVFGAAVITARAIAARSPAGVSRAARSRPSAPPARAPPPPGRPAAPAVSSALDPVPPAHHPDQLRLRDTAEPAVVPGRGVRGGRQAGAARQHIQGHPRAERRRRAARLTREHPRRTRLSRPAPPGGGGLRGEQL